MATKLEVQSLVDALYAAVRERIITGDLAGGEPLTEKNLSTHYDVARPTGKAVIERLAHDGLLVRGPHKTARVRVMETEDIRDLYYSRGFLEREVVQSLAAKQEVPPLACQAIQEMEDSIERQSVMGVVVSDISFHRALLDALGSQRLTRMYLSLMGEVQLCMAQVQTNRLLHAGVIVEEHKGILQALEKGQADLAARRMNSHLMRACNELASYRSRDEQAAVAD